MTAVGLPMVAAVWVCWLIAGNMALAALPASGTSESSSVPSSSWEAKEGALLSTNLPERQQDAKKWKKKAVLQQQKLTRLRCLTLQAQPSGLRSTGRGPMMQIPLATMFIPIISVSLGWPQRIASRAQPDMEDPVLNFVVPWGK
eukprot:s1162_g25.t1